MTDIRDEYRIIVSGAGWVDRSSRGRLRFEGPDARTFLQALVSNDVAALKKGEGVYATYLTPQGRMITDLQISAGDGWIGAGVAPGLAPALAKRFDQLIFSEDVRVEDESDRTLEIGVVGGAAAAVLGRAFGLEAAALEALSELAHVTWADGIVIRLGDSALPMFAIRSETRHRETIVARLAAAGAVAVSDALIHALRVEAGRPLFGVDMNEETIPLEAGLLDRAISTTKGCYVGQEIVIRILHRGGGRVARRLVTLAIDDGPDVPVAGTALMSGAREVGRLTSVARSPSTATPIALGYLARDAAEVGAQVQIAGADGARVTGFAR